MTQKPFQQDVITPWILRIGSFLMSVAIMVSSWFLNQAWNRINEIEKSVHKLEIETATTNGNRFTSSNWADAKAILDAEKLSLDRRVMRLEESIPVIRESLLELREIAKKKDQ